MLRASLRQEIARSTPPISISTAPILTRAEADLGLIAKADSYMARDGLSCFC
jgi:hypothetical protein